MEILWGDNVEAPEDGRPLAGTRLKGMGDLLVVGASAPYNGRKVYPKGQWIELHPDHNFTSHASKFWATPRIMRTVGVIGCFDYDLTFHLANLALERKLEKLDTEANIAFLNGPNLNLLGEREPDIYGNKGLEDIFQECKIIAPNVRFIFRQSNSEGELVTLIQKLRHETDAIIINAGAYTHTSIAIHDALRAFDDQIIELHLTNPHQREAFRHTSYITPVANGIISGFGDFGYKLALIAACLRI